MSHRQRDPTRLMVENHPDVMDPAVELYTGTVRPHPRFVTRSEAGATTFCDKWLMDGRGVARLKNGDVYEGELCLGMYHGDGTMRYADGSIFDGTWSASMPHGHGVYESAGRTTIYTGGFKEGSKHGSGEEVSQEGHFVGLYCDGLRHGLGRLRTPNGDMYDGVYRQGKLEGLCTVTFAHGDVLIAPFQNGQLHGEGVYTSTRNGDRFIEKFERGVCVLGVFCEASMMPRVLPPNSDPSVPLDACKQLSTCIIERDGTEYEGGWRRTSTAANDRTGVREGHGTLTFLDSGDVYEGDFVDDHFEGFGIARYGEIASLDDGAAVGAAAVGGSGGGFGPRGGDTLDGGGGASNPQPTGLSAEGSMRMAHAAEAVAGLVEAAAAAVAAATGGMMDPSEVLSFGTSITHANNSVAQGATTAGPQSASMNLSTGYRVPPRSSADVTGLMSAGAASERSFFLTASDARPNQNSALSNDYSAREGDSNHSSPESVSLTQRRVEIPPVVCVGLDGDAPIIAAAQRQRAGVSGVVATHNSLTVSSLDPAALLGSGSTGPPTQAQPRREVPLDQDVMRAGDDRYRSTVVHDARIAYDVTPPAYIERFEGFFHKGLRHGRGTLFLSDGSRIDGFWVKGVRHGVFHHTFEQPKQVSDEAKAGGTYLASAEASYDRYHNGASLSILTPGVATTTGTASSGERATSPTAAAGAALATSSPEAIAAAAFAMECAPKLLNSKTTFFAHGVMVEAHEDEWDGSSSKRRGMPSREGPHRLLETPAPMVILVE